MVNHSTGTAILLAISGLTNASTSLTSEQQHRVAVGPIAPIINHEKKNLRSKDRTNRALYTNTPHEPPDLITDKDTRCHNVIEGHPLVCVRVCTEITSIWQGDELLDETSRTWQHQCEDGWQSDGHHDDENEPSYVPTYSPTKKVIDDDAWQPSGLPTISFVKEGRWEAPKKPANDDWKCVPGPKRKKIWSSAPKSITSIDDPPSSWSSSSHDRGGKSGGGGTKGGKSGGGGGKSGGGGYGYGGKSGSGGKSGERKLLRAATQDATDRQLFWPFNDWAAADSPDVVIAPVKEDRLWVAPPSVDPTEPSSPSTSSSSSSSSVDDTHYGGKSGGGGYGGKSGGGSRGGKSGSGGYGGKSGGGSYGGKSGSYGGKSGAYSSGRSGCDTRGGKSGAYGGKSGGGYGGKSGSGYGGKSGAGYGSSSSSSSDDNDCGCHCDCSSSRDSYGGKSGAGYGGKSGAGYGGKSGATYGGYSSSSSSSNDCDCDSYCSSSSSSSSDDTISHHSMSSSSSDPTRKSKRISPSPTICYSPEPTPAPTNCEYDRKWYVTSAAYGYGKACTNGDDPRGTLYDSSDECCDEEFGDNSSSYGSSGDQCKRINICNDTDEPTPAPTKCDLRDWFFNPEKQVCNNVMEDDANAVEVYGSMPACCSANFDSSSSGDAMSSSDFGPSGCPYGSVYDMCCEMDYETWYFDKDSNRCTNDPGAKSWNNSYDEGRKACCMDNFGPNNCDEYNICYPEPEPESTPEPTPSPTKCTARDWYFNPYTQICNNVMEDNGNDDEVYGSMRKCCEDNFDPSSSGDGISSSDFGPSGCPYGSIYDTCCEMDYETWYYDTVSGICTNDPGAKKWNNSYENGRDECCQDRFGSTNSNKCEEYNICYLLPDPTPEPTPEPTLEPTPEPTPEPVSPSPTECQSRDWFFNPKQKVCNNVVEDNGNGDEVYGSMKKCCDDNFDPSSSGDGMSSSDFGPSGCPYGSVYDMCCEMDYETWYYDNDYNRCTNDPGAKSWNNSYKNGRNSCCEVRFGSTNPKKCEEYNICYPTEPTPEPTPAPSLETPSPTKCNARNWYFNPYSEVCNNVVEDDDNDDKVYGSMKKCCDDNFDPSSSGDGMSSSDFGPSGCPYGSVYDMCCEMDYETWYYDNDYNRCTNDPGAKSWNNSYKNGRNACCEDRFDNTNPKKCEEYNICYPTEPTPEPTPAPTTPELTPSPTKCNARNWYFNPYKQICNNVVEDSGNDDEVYGSMEQCCEDNFDPSSSGDGMSSSDFGPSGCPYDGVYDMCCEMDYETWYYDNDLERCTNDPGAKSWNNSYDNGRDGCCKDRFDSTNPEKCEEYNICYPPPPTPEPTPSPTQCNAGDWYFNPDAGVCNNVGEDDGNNDDMYDSLEDCCDANFSDYPDAGVMESGCPYGSVYDKCCEEDLDLWYYLPLQKTCKNEPLFGATLNSQAGYDDPIECCEKTENLREDDDDCEIVNYCYEQPPVDIVTPAPTPCIARKWRPNGNKCTNGLFNASNDNGDEVYDTLQQCCEETFGNGVKCVFEDICFETVDTPEPTLEPTLQPTGGSTPTVSKETTGPPTMLKGVRPGSLGRN